MFGCVCICVVCMIICVWVGILGHMCSVYDWVGVNVSWSYIGKSVMEVLGVIPMQVGL